MWVIKPYTNIKEGVHHFMSKPSLRVTGHLVWLQLPRSIESANAVEVKVAARVLLRYVDQTTAYLNYFKMASLSLLKNSEQKYGCSKTSWVRKVYFCFKSDVSADTLQPVATSFALAKALVNTFARFCHFYTVTSQAVHKFTLQY